MFGFRRLYWFAGPGLERFRTGLLAAPMEKGISRQVSLGPTASAGCSRHPEGSSSSSCHCVFRANVRAVGAATGLDGLLDPLSRCLDAESARRLVELRVDTLGARANEGTLSADELAEYEALINAADFISILKLKAKRQLDRIPQ
jgi:hypothetical protein